jgi:uncharacterized membrane protein
MFLDNIAYNESIKAPVTEIVRTNNITPEQNLFLNCNEQYLQLKKESLEFARNSFHTETNIIIVSLLILFIVYLVTEKMKDKNKKFQPIEIVILAGLIVAVLSLNF